MFESGLLRALTLVSVTAFGCGEQGRPVAATGRADIDRVISCTPDRSVLHHNDSLVLAAYSIVEGYGEDPPYATAHKALREAMIDGRLAKDSWVMALQMARFLNLTDSAVLWTRASLARMPDCPLLIAAVAKAESVAALSRH